MSDFKKDVSRESKKVEGGLSCGHYHARHNTYRDGYRSSFWGDYHDHFYDEFGGLFLYGMGYGMLYGGVSSFGRVNRAYLDNGFPEEYLRVPGEVLIPFVRFDATYQMVKSDVDSFDFAVDGGYGPAGIRFDRTRYREKNPNDTMDLTQVYGLYRMSFGDNVEIDLGFGGVSIKGGDSGRFSFTMPVLIRPGDYLGVELRPVWAGDISEYDVGLLLGGRYVSLRTGYRWLSGPTQTLDGPYAGLSVHF